MIAEIGLAALWFAAALALLQLVLAFAGLKGGKPELLGAVRPAAVTQGILTAIAFAALITLFMRSDMSVLLVATNSHSMKPWLYKFAGTWGNHEGSMLLWVTVMGVAGAAVALFERALKRDAHMATLGGQAAISLGFYAFLLFSSNPFARIAQPPADGQGLNPLLQDPGLAFHPPTLYLGYVGLSVAFSFAIGALLTRQVDAAFARAMRPWVLAAWVLLTLGITAGSYWAYYELGWGGWWFWDPVENASLMPWLAATALLHSVTVLATRDALRAWTIMLAVVAFSMSMVGTFLVRSGILTSVHAFAVDPQRGSFILALLALYIGGALALFGWRIGSVREGAPFELVSRETMLVVNNLLLTVILGLVLIGTLYPLMTEAFGHKVSVGAPYFDRIAGPIALALMVAMAAGPLTRWRKDKAGVVGKRLLVPLAIAFVVSISLSLFAWGRIGILPFLGLVIAVAVGVASLAPLWKRKLLRTPLFTYGMVVAHLGCAVSLAGMACDSAFTVEKLVAARPGDMIQTAGWSIRFRQITPIAGDNWTALQADMDAGRGGSSVVIRPQSRFFASPPTTTSEAALLTRWDGQLYVVLGEEVEGGRWQLRIWWKPFVTLIWLGGIMIALGGALALVGRERRGWVMKWRPHNHNMTTEGVEA
ncbi:MULTISPECIES: heme lyase CcmF/NrfE family subunit [Sphingobium]|jgi:cytochrome c-type biogenesis protein CcmF|uniref:heme lyase CcmF/NrfE family subunit n=1 Tax=Sphingobium TaxID=165695 RepID=UPI000DBB0735|nr:MULTISPECIES: heme lyase CcmF/NrfE family subunit [Sphingobium]KAA9018474.1 heme lyase CcmF/NrfE family subunit [Sphingobium limneticum]MBU0933880.1 heme lyase CcmF/NrfE family subunit [Alphaproteobacteria bacterium]BBC99787.1 cytochrome c-type biogenesis protein CcmF [Sphingobium sp. YG1]